jgi:FAD/FMN-containing dehydrogenase
VYSEAAGIARIEPLAIAVPVDEDDVLALIEWAHATRTPLVPRGSGSSMAGGAIGDGVIVDVSRLNDIGEVDVEMRTIRVQPGALCESVSARAATAGYRLPVNPSSARFCTIGGMVATNAAGAHSLAHGAMRPWVRALDCAFDDGSRAEIRRGSSLPDGVQAISRFLAETESLAEAERTTPSRHVGVRKNSSGYALSEWSRSWDVTDLLVGSEGTLALFLGIELSLAPIPASTATLLGGFPTLDGAVSAAIVARQHGASACELLDRTFLDVAAAGGISVPRAEAVLLADVEGDDDAETRATAFDLQHAFRAAGASDVRLALDRASAHDLWSLRHAASPTLARLDPALKSMQFIEDGVVPPEQLADYVRGVRLALERAGVRGVIFGHAGDGHIHVNPLIDVRRADWRIGVERLLDEVTELVSRLGGTASGEHGDGRLRAPLLRRCWSASAVERFARLKRAFDPAGILNPGVILPLERQRSIGDIKYDPSLPSMPSAARRALDRVERERGYALDRLSLLQDAIEQGADSPGASASAAASPLALD